MSEESKYTIKMESKNLTEHIMKLRTLRKMMYRDCNYLVMSKIMYTAWCFELQKERDGEINPTAAALDYKKYIDDPSEFMGMSIIVLDDDDQTIRIG